MRGATAGLAAWCADVAAGRDPQPLGPEATREMAAFAAAHGLSSLVASILNGAPEAVPAQTRRDVRADAERQQRRTAALNIECRRIGATERPPGLPVPVLIKGASVARWYANPTHRGYVDIDLLVPRQRFDTAVAWLERCGYVPINPRHVRNWRFHNAVGFIGPAVDGARLICEIHWCVLLERRASAVQYESIASHSDLSPALSMLQPRRAMQVLILALHMLGHSDQGRRLLWYRDMVEVATPEAVEEARVIADGAGVGWAIDRALSETQRVLGIERWGVAAPATRPAEPARGEGFAHDHDPAADYTATLGLLRALGPLDRVRYLASLLSPRRFVTPDGKIHRGELRAWMPRVARRIRNTPWRNVLSSRNRTND